MNIKEYDKRRIVDDACELYFPEQILENFKEDIKRLWENYLATLFPNVPTDRFCTGNCTLAVNKEPLLFLGNMHWINMPYIYKEDSCRNFFMELTKLPVPEIKDTFDLYLDYNEKKSRFKILFETKLLEISTTEQFEKKLPHLKHLISSLTGESNGDLAVFVDIDQISEDTVITV